MKMLTAQDLPGAQAPVGFFDPLGFATGGSDVSFFVFFVRRLSIVPSSFVLFSQSSSIHFCLFFAPTGDALVVPGCGVEAFSCGDARHSWLAREWYVFSLFPDNT